MYVINPISEFARENGEPRASLYVQPAPPRSSVRGSVRAQARASVRASMHGGLLPIDEDGERAANLFSNMVAVSGQESKAGRMRALSVAVNTREERLERDDDPEGLCQRDEGEVPSFWQVVEALSPVIMPNLHLLFVVTLSASALALVSSLAPQVVSSLYDGVQGFVAAAEEGHEGDAEAIESVMTRYVLVMSGQAFLLFLDSTLERVVSVIMELDATRLMMSRLLRKRLSFFDEYSAGELSERVYHDTDALVSIFALHLPSLICSVIKMAYGVLMCGRERISFYLKSQTSSCLEYCFIYY